MPKHSLTAEQNRTIVKLSALWEQTNSQVLKGSLLATHSVLNLFYNLLPKYPLV